LILAHIIISEDDLNQLAHQRAEAVKDDLVTNKIEPSRIFLLAVSSKPSQGKSEKLKESRVDFVIK
jgi:outer membrane protein OmpA-like peptidoglycan-associated protein